MFNYAIIISKSAKNLIYSLIISEHVHFLIFFVIVVLLHILGLILAPIVPVGALIFLSRAAISVPVRAALLPLGALLAVGAGRSM